MNIDVFKTLTSVNYSIAVWETIFKVTRQSG